ncbi:MAG: hypothetical protein ACT4PU_05960 [Planctomycetota bacterium]
MAQHSTPPNTQATQSLSQSSRAPLPGQSVGIPSIEHDASWAEAARRLSESGAAAIAVCRDGLVIDLLCSADLLAGLPSPGAAPELSLATLRTSLRPRLLWTSPLQPPQR